MKNFYIGISAACES